MLQIAEMSVNSNTFVCTFQAHGFEILCSKASERDGLETNGHLIPSNDVRWQKYVRSLKDRNYFRVLYELLLRLWKCWGWYVQLLQIVHHPGKKVWESLSFVKVQSSISYSFRQEEYTDKLFSYFSMKTYCRYSLEVPRWGTSNEYPQNMFLWKIKKNIDTCCLKKLSYLEDDICTVWCPENRIWLFMQIIP